MFKTSKLKWNWIRKRYIVTCMIYFGVFNIYTLRANLSVAIVAMTADIPMENGTTIQHQHFDWNTKERGFILSSFFYGHAMTQIIGGYLSIKLGGALIFGSGICITSILTLFTPWVAHLGPYYLMGLRFLEGLANGSTFPAMISIYSRWAPPAERSRILSISYSGFHCGTVVCMFASGILADEYGWESIFYVFGGIGLLWYIAWILIVRESPEQDNLISEEELQYIKMSLEGSKEKYLEDSKIPWKAIFTSFPVYAIFVASSAENWGFYTLFTQLPTFLKDVMDFSLKDSGFLSALPFVTIALILPFSGILADRLKSKGYLTLNQIRKLFTVIPFLWQSMCLLIVAYLMHPIGSILCIALSTGVGSFAYTGFGVIMLDMAPQYASIVYGIANTFATIPSMICPIVAGYIVQNKAISEWRLVFYLSSGIYFTSSILFWSWASADLQPWAKSKNVQHKDIDNVKCEN